MKLERYRKFHLLWFYLGYILSLVNSEKINEELNAASANEVEKKLSKYEGVDQTFELLQEGEHFLQLGEYTDIILVLGNTGSGKSTFTQFVAGDNTKMKAIEVVEGTGEYIIIDENNKIGHGILSKTIIPERVVDPETDVAYFDCPGFSDTRNAAFDIASTYLIKKTIDHAKTVKIVLTVSYSSVRVGVDRIDFMKLVRHTTEFIKDINKFKNSIVLVVTKLDNDYIKQGKEFKLVPDEKIIVKIASYIQNVKNTILENINSNINKDFYNKALNLIDIFLTKKGDKYMHIHLFRRPDEGGLISEIQLLQNGKKSLKDAIQNNMMFVKKNNYDFGFSISDNSKHNIVKLYDKISNDITDDIRNSTADMKKLLDNKIDVSKDMHNLKEEIEELRQFMVKYRVNLESCNDFKDFFIKYLQFLNGIDVNMSRETFLSILKKYKYVQFLQLVSKEKFKAKSVEWTRPIQDIFDIFTEYKAWYNFLTDLYKKLSYYKLHEQMYNSSQISLNLRHKRDLDDNLKYIIDDLKTADIRDFETVNKIEFDSHKTHDVQMVLNAIYQNNMTLFCPTPDTLIVKGDFIKFSKIGAVHPCASNIKTIRIYALNTIFIDADVDRTGEELNMFIMAPKWEIIGKRRIILDGKSETKILPRAAAGNDGRPGLPGGPAGNFFGIAQEIVNGDNLIISANGGRGGPGQDGGHGLRGINGHNQIPYGEQYEGESIMRRYGYYQRSFNKRTVAESFWEGLGYVIGIYHQIETIGYYVYGQPGTKGGTAGQAGAGGIGGQQGNIEIHTFKSANINIKNNPGLNGRNGNSGAGGLGGENADDFTIDYLVKKTYWFGGRLKSRTKGWFIRTSISKGRAPLGNTNYEITFSGVKQPKSCSYLLNPAYDITDYKLYILENIKDSVKRRNLLTFYLKISNDIKIKKIYDTFSLLNELQKFESKTEYFINDWELNSFYSSLLERIQEYATKPKDYEDDKNYKKVLNYLYAITLSKTITIKENTTDNNLIIDIDGYFKMILNDFNKLKHHANEVVKNQYSDNYKKSVEAKIAEAKQLIENDIILEIDQIGLQIENKIEALVNEIIEMQENTKTKKDELIQKRNELKDMLDKKSIFESLKIISAITKLFGPVGETVGDVIQATTKVAQSLTLSDSKKMNSNVFLPDGVKLLVSGGVKLFDNLINMKEEGLKNVLDNIAKEIIKYPNDFEDLYNTTTSLKHDLQIAQSENKLDLPAIMSLNEKLLTSLAKTAESFEKHNLTSIGEHSETTEILNFFVSTAHMAELFTQSYLQQKDDEKRLQEMAIAIGQQDVKIMALREYQVTIYDRVYPVVKTILEDFSQYETRLKSKTRVFLDISKWHMRSTIKDVKLLLSQITKDFEIQEDLLRFIEKLDEGLSTLINVYDKIQIYTEQKEFADYIADINSLNSVNIKTDNQTINKALDKLDLTVKSNIVVAQYKKALNNFKQYIFPFAHHYLDEYELPHEIQVENNIENIIANASRQIEKLKSKLSERKLLLIRNFDEFVFEEYFQSGENFNGPFLIWDNTNYENTISKFLSGEEITVKANILNSIHEKNAIKFNNIRVDIKSKNFAINSKLNEKLKLFDVVMTHSGNSDFRCDNDFYTLVSDKQEFYFSFEKDQKGEPVRKNQVYKKISNGQYMLSPYTTWTLQLKKVSKGAFSDLNFAKGNVDLELAGHGQYVSSKSTVCSRDLRKYYKSADAISVNDIIDRVNSS